VSLNKIIRKINIYVSQSHYSINVCYKNEGKICYYFTITELQCWERTENFLILRRNPKEANDLFKVIYKKAGSNVKNKTRLTLKQNLFFGNLCDIKVYSLFSLTKKTECLIGKKITLFFYLVLYLVKSNCYSKKKSQPPHCTNKSCGANEYNFFFLITKLNCCMCFYTSEREWRN
jgi:hypothetical protein